MILCPQHHKQYGYFKKKKLSPSETNGKRGAIPQSQLELVAINHYRSHTILVKMDIGCFGKYW